MSSACTGGQCCGGRAQLPLDFKDEYSVSWARATRSDGKECEDPQYMRTLPHGKTRCVCLQPLSRLKYRLLVANSEVFVLFTKCSAYTACAVTSRCRSWNTKVAVRVGFVCREAVVWWRKMPMPSFDDENTRKRERGVLLGEEKLQWSCHRDGSCLFGRLLSDGSVVCLTELQLLYE